MSDRQSLHEDLHPMARMPTWRKPGQTLAMVVDPDIMVPLLRTSAGKAVREIRWRQNRLGTVHVILAMHPVPELIGMLSGESEHLCPQGWVILQGLMRLLSSTLCSPVCVNLSVSFSFGSLLSSLRSLYESLASRFAAGTIFCVVFSCGVGASVRSNFG